MEKLKVKNKLLVFISIVAVILFSLCFVSCDQLAEVIPDEETTEVKTEETTYTISFNTNGGNEIESLTVTAGKVVSKPKDPVKINATFDGWYTDANCTEKFNFSSHVTSNLTLYAKWNAILYYSVSFDTDGANSISAVTVVQGEYLSLPEDPVKEGFTFKGWFKDKDFNEPYYLSPVNENFTLYAKWSKSVYRVFFETDCDNVSVPEQSVEHGKKAQKPSDLSREHYTFEGWFEQMYTGSNDKKFDFNKAITEQTTIYAGWKLDGYEVKFNSRGGSNVAPQIFGKNEAGIVEVPVAPEKTGYNFAGWYKESKCETPYDFTTPVTASITLYAKWEIKSFTVSFIDKNGQLYRSLTVDYKNKVEKPENPQTEGYKFLGWYINDEEKFDFNTSITADTVLNSHWEKCYYDVSFVTNCDTEVSSKTVGYGDYIDYDESLEKQGYVFAGWYKDDKFTQLFDTDEDCSNTVVTGPLTLYAKWELKDCTITFVTFTGESNNFTQQVKYGNPILLPTQTPVRGNDYEFDGWYWDLNYNEPVDFDDDSPIYDDCFVYAKWISTADVSIRITLDVNNSDVTGYCESDEKYYYFYVTIPTGSENVINHCSWRYTDTTGHNCEAYGYLSDGKARFQFNPMEYSYNPGVYVIEWIGYADGYDGNYYSYTFIVTIENQQ